jgi:hypothetical protein
LLVAAGHRRESQDSCSDGEREPAAHLATCDRPFT